MDLLSFLSKNITYVIVAINIFVTYFIYRKDKIKDEEGKKYKRLNLGVVSLSVLIILFSLVEKRNSDIKLDNANNERISQHNSDSIRIISLKDSLNKTYSAVKDANNSLDIVKSKSTIILSNIDTTISLQNTSKSILKSQINSSEKLLKINKELLNANTNDDSLILIFPGRNGDFITFDIINTGFYPVQNIKVNYPNREFQDSVMKQKVMNNNFTLSNYESNNWRISKTYNLLPRVKEKVYDFKIEKEDSIYVFNFDVNYQKTNLMFSYTLKLGDRIGNQLIRVNEFHQNLRNRKKFYTKGIFVIYY